MAQLVHPPPAPEPIAGLFTLQFANGGLFDSRPVDGYKVHLLAVPKSGGTAAPSLCGIDRFNQEGPGWSIRGGCSDPKHPPTPCEGCATEAAAKYPGLPVAGLGMEVMAARLGVETFDPWPAWWSGKKAA